MRHAGSIKAVQEIWVRRAGVTSKVWPTLQTLNFSSAIAASQIGLTSVDAALVFSSTGNVFDFTCANNICTPASTQHSNIYSATNFIRFTETSRTGLGTISTPPLGVWLLMNTNRDFLASTNTQFDFTTWEGTAEISTVQSPTGVFISGPVIVSAYFEGGQ